MQDSVVPQTTFTPSNQARVYYLDWLRVLAILGVFLFHSTHIFDFGTWQIKNADGSCGDQSSEEFFSNPIELPDGVALKDSLLGERVQIDADLVVLATAMRPQRAALPGLVHPSGPSRRPQTWQASPLRRA